MEQINIIDLKGHKITKSLPKLWVASDKDKPNDDMFVLKDFAIYLEKLYNSLIGIKKNYQKEFNNDNTYTIDEYIGLFNSAFNKILKTLIPDKDTREFLLDNQVSKLIRYRNPKFGILEVLYGLYDKSAFIAKNNKLVGFSDSAYKKISSYANQIFMIEKMCSFTTRKFWQQELTKAEDLDLNKKYKILVKCILPESWREDNKSKKFDTYMKSRNYHSTSLIDEKHFYSTFFSFTGKYALLLVDYDDEKFICASPTDSYSEEVIDRVNLIKDKKIFSDVLLQNDKNIENANHKFFAEAVECETPKSLLENITFYTEVNMIDIKPKAVIAPNEMSVKFAEKIAKEYGDLPVIVKPEKY